VTTQFRRLSNDEFDQAVNDLRINQANTEAARLAMVEGSTQRFVAKKLGVSERVLSATVQRVWNKFIENSPLPDGWDRAIIELPKDELISLQKKSIELKNEALEEQAINQK
jgi:predicted DNA-binding protein (UPF0251 family)